MLTIRNIAEEDAAVVAELCGELGYPASESALLERIRRISTGRAAFVAVVERVVGFIEVETVEHLTTEPTAEIAALVVSHECRSQGVGAALVQHAEQWARHEGLASIRVRSRTTRDAAHRFYLREGYEKVKTSVVFAKGLG